MNIRPRTAFFTACLALLALPLAAQAQEHRGDGRGQERSNGRGERREQVDQRAERGYGGRGYVLDNRFDHGRYYPQPGLRVQVRPPGGYALQYRGSPYYYNGGIWYRPWGPRYEVVRPPFGIGVSILPPFYTTVWFSGVPYYYADGTYYLWEPMRREYVVTSAPAREEAASTQAPAEPETYAYPRSGQSDSQMASDRYECHDWATRQSGFDPTQPLGGVASNEVGAKRDDYRRAERACLEGRGYSVN
jgi:hypothetical protein